MAIETRGEPDEPGRRAAIECPTCGEGVEIDIPDGDPELVVRPYVAAWGEHETVTCTAGHRFWVYFC